MPQQAESRSSSNYTLSQIVLHWSIAALVIWQLFFTEDPPQNRAGAAVQGFWAEVFSSSHLWVGFAILGLVLVRIAVRLSQGAPPAVASEGRLQALAARIAHLLFYVLLVFMPVTGILDYYFGLPTGDLHELGEPLFIALIVVHVVAAIWHQFILRDGLLRRMAVPGT